jgi:alpha-galactosidase
METRFFKTLWLGLVLIYVGICSPIAQGAESPQPSAESSVALTPPMGWSSWNTFEKEIHEDMVRQVADALVSSGMKDAGYTYVNVDDGWQLGIRDAEGNLQHDPKKFPSGMKALGDYIHSKGLKFGIYTSAGVQTCMRLEGSYGHEEHDVQQFASWGVDFVKVDWCCTRPDYLSDKERKCPQENDQDYGKTGQKELYQRWHLAVSHAGRPMVLSICEWGIGKPWLWGAETGNMWRTTMDILPCRACKKSWWGLGWQDILDQQVGLERYASRGHWNDPDMLVVGVRDLSNPDGRAHFSFWSLLAAPLIAGNDPRAMSQETREILTNPEVIAINQDPLGVQGKRVSKNLATEIWVRQLANKAMAVILFNRSDEPRSIRVIYSDLAVQMGSKYEIRDLWKRKDIGLFSGKYVRTIPPHDVVMLKMTPLAASNN